MQWNYKLLHYVVFEIGITPIDPAYKKYIIVYEGGHQLVIKLMSSKKVKVMFNLTSCLLQLPTF